MQIHSINVEMVSECGAGGGMRIGRGNQSSQRKLIRLPLCSSQIVHEVK